MLNVSHTWRLIHAEIEYESDPALSIVVWKAVCFTLNTSSAGSVLL